MKISAHIKYIILTLLFIGGSLNMLLTTRNIIKSSKRLDKAKEEVLSLETKKEELLKDIEYKKTEVYVEEIARNELNLIKPGEEIYIYPKDEAKKPKNKIFRSNTHNQDSKKPIKAWMELFF